MRAQDASGVTGAGRRFRSAGHPAVIGGNGVPIALERDGHSENRIVLGAVSGRRVCEMNGSRKLGIARIPPRCAHHPGEVAPSLREPPWSAFCVCMPSPEQSPASLNQQEIRLPALLAEG